MFSEWGTPKVLLYDGHPIRTGNISGIRLLATCPLSQGTYDLILLT